MPVFLQYEGMTMLPLGKQWLLPGGLLPGRDQESTRYP